MNRIGYHDYEGIVLRMDERERLLKNLGQNNFLVLRNHVLLTAAPDIPRALLWMYVLEQACKVQSKALAWGRPLPYMTDRTTVAEGTSCSVRVDLGDCRIFKKTNQCRNKIN